MGRGRHAEAASARKSGPMATTVRGKNSGPTLALQLIAGTDKHLTSATQVLLAGGSFTPAEVTAKLQSLVKLRTDVDAAKATTQAKLAAEKADMPALRIFMDAYATFVRAAFGTQPDVLADFGLQPKTRAPLTVEAKAAAVAKRAATRAARHTMGSKQRKDIKGAVTGVTITPQVSSPPVATAPATTAPATGASAAAPPHVP
jgi:hypothetical protein